MTEKAVLTVLAVIPLFFCHSGVLVSFDFSKARRNHSQSGNARFASFSGFNDLSVFYLHFQDSCPNRAYFFDAFCRDYRNS